MLPAAVHLASLAGLWAAWQGTVGVSAGSRASARSAAGASGQDVGYDLDLSSGLGGTVTEGRFNLSLGYAPLLTLRDVNAEQRSSLVMHTGYLSMGYAEREWSLSLSQSFSVGTTSFRGLRTTPVNPMVMPNPMTSRVDLVPGVETAKIFNESTSGSFGYRWDPRVSSTLTGGYSITGGSGSSQVAYPQMRFASAGLGSSYTMSSVDTVGAQLDSARVSTRGGTMRAAANQPVTRSPDHLYYTLSLAATWSHRFSTISGMSLSGGAAGYTTTTPGFTPYYSLALTGGGAVDTQLVRGRGYTISTGLGMYLGPALNPLAATMQQRATGTGRISLTMRRFSLNANGDGTQTFPRSDPGATRLFSAGIGANYTPFELVDVLAEYRSTWQTVASTSIPRLWVVFVGIGVRAPPIRI